MGKTAEHIELANSCLFPILTDLGPVITVTCSNLIFFAAEVFWKGIVNAAQFVLSVGKRTIFAEGAAFVFLPMPAQGYFVLVN
jgi:hypothetical protein